jgi:pyruvate dehydrogenase E2 component (dihydrolipoamide acetyltransferase)
VATEVKIPDIGDFKDVPIIEVHVKEGDAVNADDPLVSLESDRPPWRCRRLRLAWWRSC